MNYIPKDDDRGCSGAGTAIAVIIIVLILLGLALAFNSCLVIRSSNINAQQHSDTAGGAKLRVQRN